MRDAAMHQSLVSQVEQAEARRVVTAAATRAIDSHCRVRAGSVLTDDQIEQLWTRHAMPKFDPEPTAMTRGESVSFGLALFGVVAVVFLVAGAAVLLRG